MRAWTIAQIAALIAENLAGSKNSPQRPRSRANASRNSGP